MPQQEGIRPSEPRAKVPGELFYCKGILLVQHEITTCIRGRPFKTNVGRVSNIPPNTTQVSSEHLSFILSRYHHE
jgi:hypothetical protein